MKSANILPTVVEKGSPVQEEMDPGMWGSTRIKGGKVRLIQTPPDPLIRVHELMHALHTPGAPKYGKTPFARQMIEDMRLHMHHWPWAPGETPPVIADSGLKLCAAEQKVLPKMCNISPEAKFALAVRNAICESAITGRPPAFPKWFEPEKIIAGNKLCEHIRHKRYDEAATLVGWANINNFSGFGMFSVDGPGSTYGSDDGPPPIVHLDDKGPFVEKCRDEPYYELSLATSGARIHRPALRRPVLPQRIFWRRRNTDLKGGSVIIDASGSMAMSTEDILQMMREIPYASVALYNGNDQELRPEGWIYVAAKEGYRRSEDDICEYLDKRDAGNSIDLAAIEWLLDQPAPRVMITDRGFCGVAKRYIFAAVTKLDSSLASGAISSVRSHWNEYKEEE